LRGECTLEQYEETKKELAQDFATIQKANKAGFLTDDLYDAIQAISKKEYIDRDGLTKHWLTDHETETLSIRKGTLTAEERSIMESHVVLTRKMLERIRFSKEYSHVTRWASNHHELLNGSGYPQHLKGEQLSFQERLLTILDIFDALTASDRPYRKAIPREKAFDILRSMVDEGKLDGEVLELYLSSDAWAEGE
ncbi:MAG: HD domain-containing protein, partial [Lachnospiraceae bacterium]|nr:HD domain-containing protein [Lachnospiraceae bacterium]